MLGVVDGWTGVEEGSGNRVRLVEVGARRNQRAQREPDECLGVTGGIVNSWSVAGRVCERKVGGERVGGAASTRAAFVSRPERRGRLFVCVRGGWLGSV